MDLQLSIFLTKERQEAERAAEAERQAIEQAAEEQRQAEREAETAKRQAAAERERERAELQIRQQNAKTLIGIISKDVECKLVYTCGIYRITVSIVNRSSEILSEVDFGWAFLSPQDPLCPSSYQTKHRAAVSLRPADTATLSMDGYDGPSVEATFRYCIAVTGVEITPDANLSIGELQKRVLSSISAKNYSDEMKWCRLAATKGDVFCFGEIGRLYMLGQGVAQNYAEAMRWLRMAADKGNAVAQDDLGRIYAKGLGVARDYAEAMHWLRMAADQGDAYAQGAIGYLYMNGEGVPQNYAEAMRWFRMAADKGDPVAQYDIGVMTALGKGITKDCATAKQWFNKAAAAGNQPARAYLQNGAGGACQW
jgi:TPR repeat protein